MNNWKGHTILSSCTIKQVLETIDKQAIVNNNLFVVNEGMQLLGSLSDGDIRRAVIRGISVERPVTDAMFVQCSVFNSLMPTEEEMQACRAKGIHYVPVINAKRAVIAIIDLEQYKETIPVDAVIMAGGKGKRLLPLTENIPKPLLMVGDKPIIEHNIDRLKQFGVNNIFISINHLGYMLQEYFGDGTTKELRINYVAEGKPLGTVGSVKLIKEFERDVVLIMNSDLLTNIDYADFYREFEQTGADMAVAATTYHVDIPYAVLEVDGHNTVTSLREKPRYTYYSNAGIYLLKKELLDMVPENEYFDAPDLMNKVIIAGHKLITYPLLGYWLDIGKMHDYQKAQEDIKHIKF